MDPIFVTDAARGLHLAAMAGGFGLALFADALALKSLLRPIQRTDVQLMGRVHLAIMLALGALWLSGLGLLYIRTGFELAAFSPKLMVKLGVVVFLTLNAFIIGAVALPTYARHMGWRFSEFTFEARVKLTTIAGLSMSCWLSALALGVFSQLKPMDFSQLQTIFTSIFLVILGATMVMALMAPLLGRPLGRIGAMLKHKSDWALPAHLRR